MASSSKKDPRTLAVDYVAFGPLLSTEERAKEAARAQQADRRRVVDEEKRLASRRTVVVLLVNNSNVPMRRRCSDLRHGRYVAGRGAPRVVRPWSAVRFAAEARTPISGVEGMVEYAYDGGGRFVGYWTNRKIRPPEAGCIGPAQVVCEQFAEFDKLAKIVWECAQELESHNLSAAAAQLVEDNEGAGAGDQHKESNSGTLRSAPPRSPSAVALGTSAKTVDDADHSDSDDNTAAVVDDEDSDDDDDDDDDDAAAAAAAAAAAPAAAAGNSFECTTSDRATTSAQSAVDSPDAVQRRTLDRDWDWGFAPSDDDAYNLDESSSGSGGANGAGGGGGDAPARTFGDRYYLSPTVLGKGAYSEVRLCVSRRTRQKAAVKIIVKENSTEQFMKEEIAIMRAVKHENIVALYDVFEEVATLHLVMELAPGGTLLEFVTERSATSYWTELEVAKVFRQLLDAVGYLHRSHIIHRDIKPANVLVSNTGLCKLTDFGLGAVQDAHRRPMYLACGTLKFMSPEVIECRKSHAAGYGTQCDLWSCGVLLFFLLCGYYPFQSTKKDPHERREQMFDKISNAKYTYDSHYWRPVSAAAKSLIDELLVVDATRRLTAERALEHRWLADMDKCATSHKPLAHSRLLKYLNTRFRFDDRDHAAKFGSVRCDDRSDDEDDGGGAERRQRGASDDATSSRKSSSSGGVRGLLSSALKRSGGGGGGVVAVSSSSASSTK